MSASPLTSWLVALRVARREARRAKGRTLLVVAMIAMPIMALAFASTAYGSMKVSPEQQRVREIGAATGTVSFSPADNVADPQAPTDASLSDPALNGIRFSPYFQDYVTMRTAGGVGTIETFGIDTTDPMTTGIVRTINGRTPVADNEIAVTASALDRLGVQVGDSVSVFPRQDDPSFPLRTYRVVGVVEIGGRIDQEVLFRPSQSPHITWFYQSPAALTPAQIAALSAVNLAPDPAAPMSQGPIASAFNAFGIGTIISGLGVLEVVLLAGPAFAVGAKRRQRDLALAAANGAAPATIRRIVLADGVVAGVLAAITGIAIGLVGAALSRGLIEEHLTHERGGGFQVSPLTLALIVAIAIVTGVLGALVPAYTVGKQDVIEALSGRRGITKSRALWLVVGLAGVAVATVIAYEGAVRHSSGLILTGLILGELGLVLCTPKLLGLVGRLGRALPLAPHIALRDTARRRAAAAPAISAVMAAVAGSVALTVYLSGSDNRSSDYVQSYPTGTITASYNGDPTSGASAEQRKQTIIDVIHRVAPTATTAVSYTVDCDCGFDVRLPEGLNCPYPNDRPLSKEDQRRARADKRCENPYSGLGMTIVDHGAAAGPALGLSGPALARASAALDSGQAIVTDPRFVDGSGHLTLRKNFYRSDGTPAPAQMFRIPAIAVSAPGLSDVLLPTSSAHLLQVTFRAVTVIASAPDGLDQRQLDSLNEALLTAGLDPASRESGPPHTDNSVALILAVAAGVIALGAATIATGLAAADGRADLTILGAVGATPRVRRTLALAQAGVIAFLGALLGVIAGFGAAAAIITGLNRIWAFQWPAPPPYPITVPWLNLLISLLIVPVVAMLGAGLLTRSRLPSERRAD